MAVQFKVPASPARSTLTIDTFLGADFTNDPANVDIDKSPDLLNMIRDVPGKVRKTMGYKTIANFDGTINGYHTMRGKAHGLVHVGNKLYYGDYDDPTLLYSNANNNRSRSWQFKATQVTETKTAPITDGVANFNTIDREKVTNLKVKIVAKQSGSGTPSPSNIRPISGYTEEEVWVYGRNHLPNRLEDLTRNGVTVTKNSDGTYTFNGTATATSDIYINDVNGTGSSTSRLRFGRDGRYLYSGITGGSNTTYRLYVAIRRADGTITYGGINSGQGGFDLASDEEVSLFVRIYSGYTCDNITVEPMIRLREYIEDTTFYPYIGKTYTTPFNQTVYGGTLDVLTGELTIDKGFITVNGTENIGKSVLTDCDIYIFGVTGADFSKPFITSAFEYSATAVNAIGYAWRGSSTVQIRMGYAPYGTTTVDDFKDWLSQNPLQICYTLATPITLSLTPQTVKALVGENHIMASTGDVTSCAYTELVTKDRVCILDGKALLLWDGDTVTTAAQNATIPVTMIGGNPAGGGTSYYPLNLLSPGFTEQFLGTAADKDYQLSYTDLDDTEVRAEVLQNDGTWLTKVEGTDFTVDRETGVVSFIVEPGESPVTGEDNVKITAFKTVVGYSDRINKCSVGILYGASGDLNRLFVSGNPDYVNYQWYSDTDDPTYFPDTNYMLIGTSKSAIIGYSIINSLLAVYKDHDEIEQNIVLVGSIDLDGQVTFATKSTIHGTPAISKDSFAVLAGEPIFLTALGVYALTSQDVSAKELTNLRSFYLNGKLLEERDLDKSFAYVYKDFYILALNQRFYILDGLQAVQTDNSAPYSTRQFVGYYRDNVEANVLWEEDGALCFGTTDGKIKRFYTEVDNINSYNDDGESIHARWETPDIDGKLFYKNKTFRYLAIRLKRAMATSVIISGMKRGLWTLLTTIPLQARYLVFWNVTFSKFSFSSDMTSRTLSMKMRIKKVDKARFRFENDEVNESFAIDKIGLEFVEKGNFKS